MYSKEDIRMYEGKMRTPGEITRYDAYAEAEDYIREAAIGSARFTALSDYISSLAADLEVSPNEPYRPLSSDEAFIHQLLLGQRIRGHEKTIPNYLEEKNALMSMFEPKLYKASLAIMFEPQDPLSQADAKRDVILMLETIRTEAILGKDRVFKKTPPGTEK